MNKIDNVYVTSIVLQYPFVLVVGNDENLGLKIWNLSDASLVRSVLVTSNLYPIITNKYSVCVTDGPSLYFFNLKKILDKHTETEKVEKMIVEQSFGMMDQSIHISIQDSQIKSAQ